MNQCNARLTVVGSQREVQAFQRGAWETVLAARHCELLETSPGRYSCQFETNHPPLDSLKRLSQRLPKLTLLLDYEVEAARVKGLAKAKAGSLESYRIKY